MGSPRPLRMVSKMLTTTYASIAASSTARPPTPTATRRATAPWSGDAGAVVTAGASPDSTSGCGCTDGHRRVEVGQLDGHRNRLAALYRDLERALEHLVGGRVDPQRAGDGAGGTRHERGDRGRVGGGGQLVRVVPRDRLLADGGHTGGGLHQ